MQYQKSACALLMRTKEFTRGMTWEKLLPQIKMFCEVRKRCSVQNVEVLLFWNSLVADERNFIV